MSNNITAHQSITAQKQNIRIRKRIKKMIRPAIKTLMTVVIALVIGIGMVAMLIGASIQEQTKLSKMTVMEGMNE